VGLDAAAFQACVVSAPVSARIRQDLDEGARAGVSGTPTMFLGTLDKDGRLKVLRKVVGASTYANVKTAIDALLSSADLAK
jgi:protein-disulfide isomerase